MRRGFPLAKADRLPAWAKDLGETVGDVIHFHNTGIFPLVANNLQDSNPVHRAGAWLVDRISAVLTPLRNNLGALTTLLAVGLLFLLALSFVTQWRRRAMARAATDLATTLRNQIHRQMYRLGQSSLPTEGIGPVVNIWTREVNDIRDGLFADLRFTPGMQILAIGLILIALLTSPILTIFLGSLGLLVGYLSRQLNRDTRQAQDAALRDVSVQLCLLHEDLGLLRTVRIHGAESYDRQRFDEHLERFREADSTAHRHRAQAQSDHGLALRCGLGDCPWIAWLHRADPGADLHRHNARADGGPGRAVLPDSGMAQAPSDPSARRTGRRLESSSFWNDLPSFIKTWGLTFWRP